ncbi:DNA mismatch repair protein MutL [Andrena cerasifolii]|uniref:DNA mismatch repair protein MutL n=1 Tax=Andrena cerasifolii TaxID=2819439 RepID=UPI004037DE05
MEKFIMETSNVASFTECVLQLVSNSLNANSTAIAIRIYVKERYIQVVDDGAGIPKQVLDTVAEYDMQNAYNWSILDICNCNSKNQTLANIRRLSDAVMISSRSYTSPTTYMKIFKGYHAPNIVTIPERQACGTTVSIYGFHELTLNKWNVSLMRHLLENIALVNPQASFSIRDDEKKELITKISKPRTSIHIFQVLYDNKVVSLNNMWYIEDKEKSYIQFSAYIGLSNIRSNSPQFIFLNNIPVRCPLILREISDMFIAGWKPVRRVQRNAFILLFITCPEYIFTIEQEKRTLMLPRMHDLLQSVRVKMINIFNNNVSPLSRSVSRRIRRNGNLIYSNENSLNNMNLFKNTSILRQPPVIEAGQPLTAAPRNSNNLTSAPSEWSNWSYKSPTAPKRNKRHGNSVTFYKRFDFLPEKLHKVLRARTKLTKTDFLNDSSGSIFSFKLKTGLQIPDTLLHQEMDVRPCKAAQRFHEFRLKKEHLKFIKILGQMNNEFIVGLLIHNDVKVLLLMDQHAIHERIRYEDLLRKYKLQARHQLHSIKLRDPISINLPIDKCNSLASRQMQLTKFGVSLSVISDTTVAVRAVPECLKRNKYHHDETKLKLNVQNLLNEILQSHSTNNDLPLTIHNAIAMEACHGTLFISDITSKVDNAYINIQNIYFSVANAGFQYNNNLIRFYIALFRPLSNIRVFQEL